MLPEFKTFYEAMIVPNCLQFSNKGDRAQQKSCLSGFADSVKAMDNGTLNADNAATVCPQMAQQRGAPDATTYANACQDWVQQQTSGTYAKFWSQ